MAVRESRVTGGDQESSKNSKERKKNIKRGKDGEDKRRYRERLLVKELQNSGLKKKEN